MKIRITLKDPDGVSNSIQEAVEESLVDAPLDEDEKDLIRENRTEKFIDELSRWITYGEYATIEFDTEAGTATVVETNKQ